MRAGDTETFEYAIDAPVAEWDRLIGELYALGTLGVLEREGRGLTAWFHPGASVEASVRALADPSRGVTVTGRVRPEEDWEKSWRAGLVARRVAGLWIRPSWVESRGLPELVIDPQQAFGSGEHVTTRLALELLLEALSPGDRVLDVGSGSGILALAALRLGATDAVGVEIDPVACRNARENARHNQLSPRWVCGTIGALRETSFDLVVSNMLWTRVEPELSGLVVRAARSIVLSGFLEGERERVRDAVGAFELAIEAERSEVQSGDRWCALRARRQAAARQASSNESSVSSSR